MSKVFKALDDDPDIEHVLVHTGQHYDELLSGVFFDELDIREPDYNLAIGDGGCTHYEQLGRVSTRLIELFKKESLHPHVVMFLGDSNSVGAAFPLKKEGYKVAHIEAGMRSGDKRMLEEINRIVCDHCSDVHFVYHEDYKQNLLREGLPEENIFVVGNTIVEPLSEIWEPSTPSNDYILMDIHRPENFKHSHRMSRIMLFANKCAERFGVPVKMVAWGRTLSALEPLNMGNVELSPLMSYKDYIKAQWNSKFIISDSGTAQEEPSLMHVPVIVPRDFTERPQSVEHGCSYMLKVDDMDSWEEPIRWVEEWEGCYSRWLGDGNTSQEIVKCLKSRL
jgi:UDP-N-acetylglucosamine 2-epimerase (non-hydrolysing)